jgi:hypothetical protein
MKIMVLLLQSERNLTLLSKEYLIMPTLAQREIRFSDVVKSEYNMIQGFSRKTVPVTLSPDSKIGDVVADPGDGSAWSLVTAATTSNPLAVVVDPILTSLIPETGTSDEDVAVIYRIATVGDTYLNIGADAVQEDVFAALDSQKIEVGDQLA